MYIGSHIIKRQIRIPKGSANIFHSIGNHPGITIHFSGHILMVMVYLFFQPDSNSICIQPFFPAGGNPGNFFFGLILFIGMLQYCIASLSCVYKRLYSICSRNAQNFMEHLNTNLGIRLFQHILHGKIFLRADNNLFFSQFLYLRAVQFTDFSHSFQILFQKYILVLVIKPLKFIKTDSTLHNIKSKT